MEDYKTYEFYEFYYMLWNRKKVKKNKFTTLLRSHYYPMFLVMKYMQYADIYKDVRKIYFSNRNPDITTKIYEETIEIHCNSITGIKITYDDDPVNCLRSLGPGPNVKSLCKRAVMRNHVKCLEYLHRRKCDTCCVYDLGRSDTGECECGGTFKDGYVINMETCLVAVENTDIRCIKYMHSRKCAKCGVCESKQCDCGGKFKNGCKMYEQILNVAAEHGNLAYLKYFFSCGGIFGCKTLELAVRSGNFECIKYLCENGCPRESGALLCATIHNRLDIVKYLYESGCRCKQHTLTRYAVENNNMEMQKFFIENGFCVGWSAVEIACSIGNLAMLEFIYPRTKKSTDLITFCTSEAIKNGHTDCVKFMHSKGGQWKDTDCYNAALGGHLECLKYIRANGAPWARGVCEIAAYNGNIDILKYGHENGSPGWGEYAISIAAARGHFECLKYMHENKCPFDGNINSNDKKCLKYIKNVMLKNTVE